MNKCLVLFVEGDTEIEFYKYVISNARQKRTNRTFDINIEYKNVKGIGGFKNTALRKFIKEIKPKYGILSFLHLPKKTKTSGKNGYDKLKKLFKQANKMYYKGMKSNGMIEQLNIDKIVQSVYTELQPLYEELGIYKKC